MPPGGEAFGLRPAQVMERGLREVLVGAGLTEIVSYAFTAQAAAGADPRVALENPLAEDQGALRDALVPGLLQTLRANVRRGTRDVRIFEMGRVFLPSPQGAAPREERRLALLLSGAFGTHWSGKRRAADFYDAKGIVELLGRHVGGLEVRPAATLPAHIHPGKGAQVFHKGQAIGYVGALHPDAAVEWELREEAVVAEIGLESILASPPAVSRFEALSRFPTVARDLSVVVDLALSAEALGETVRAAGGPILRSATVTDRYQGAPVPPGKVSLTVSLVYHDASRTLTGEEVQSSVDAVVAALRARGAEIRGE